MRVLNGDQMREADRKTIEEIGIPSMVLMENAGRQVVAAMETAFDHLPDARVAILCGRGNNGGDGFVVARVLWQRGVDAQVYVLGRLNELAGDARANLDILGRLGLPVVEVHSEQDWELHGGEVLRSDIVVDAMFGTGLKTPLGGLYETVAQDLNAADVPVVAVDLPSGLSADTESPIGPLSACHPHRHARRSQAAVDAAAVRAFHQLAQDFTSLTPGKKIFNRLIGDIVGWGTTSRKCFLPSFQL